MTVAGLQPLYLCDVCVPLWLLFARRQVSRMGSETGRAAG